MCNIDDNNIDGVSHLRYSLPILDGFDPFRDLGEVEQTGFIDLCSAFVRGVIPGSIQPTDESFNNMSDPDVILPHSDDTFSSIRTAAYVASELEKKEASAKENDSHKNSGSSESE